MFKEQHQRIVISLLFAGLIHSILFLFLTTGKKAFHIEFMEEPQSLSVSLDSIYIASSKTTAQKPKKAKMLKKKAIPLKSQKTNENNNIDFSTKTKPQPKTERPAPTTELYHDTTIDKPLNTQAFNNNPALNRAKLITKLRKDLKQYFYYPSIARRKNIQGTVLLGFGINQTGIIHDIHVIKSSGHIVLDLAAEDSIQKLHKVNWEKGMFAKSDINLELPIIYELME